MEFICKSAQSGSITDEKQLGQQPQKLSLWTSVKIPTNAGVARHATTVSTVAACRVLLL